MQNRPLMLPLLLAGLFACATPGVDLDRIPPGTYVETGPMNPETPDPLAIHTWTFVSLDSPISPRDLPNNSYEVVDYFDPERPVNFCLVEQMGDPDGSFDYVVSFDTPRVVASGKYRVRSFETYHFDAWLDLEATPQGLVGEFNSRGFGGPTTIPILAPRVAGPSPTPCLNAIRELLAN